MWGLRGTAPEGGTLTIYFFYSNPYAEHLGAQPLPVDELEVGHGFATHIAMSSWHEAVRVKAPTNAIRIH